MSQATRDPMFSNLKLTVFHAPHTRSTGVRILLEELQAPHELVAFDSRSGDLDSPAFLAINPMGKVPCIRYGDTVVTEQPAIYTFLADTFREHAQLSPDLHDPNRGVFLRWMSFYGSSFEPAITDRAMKRDGGSRAMSPYGTYDEVLSALVSHLRERTYFLGAHFSAVDVLWGSALGWMIGFGIIQEADSLAVLKPYSERVAARPAFQKVTKIEKVLADELQAKGKGKT